MRRVTTFGRYLAAAMRARSADVGIGVSARTVRVVALRRGVLAWHDERELSDALTLADALTELLASVPASRWRRPRAVAAMGPSAMHLRRIVDLPAAARTRVLTAIVREDVARYFVQSGAPLLTTQACRRGDAVWVGALERPVVDTLVTACARHDVALAAIVPAVSLAGMLVVQGTIRWPDGALVALAEFQAGALVAYRRISASQSARDAAPAACPAPVIAGMGDDAARFTDAWLAAKSGVGHHLAHRPEPVLTGDRARRGSRRLPAAAAACVAAALIALAMPLVAARRAEWQGRRAIAALGLKGQAAAREERSLALATRELRALAAFDRAAAPVTVMLASLTSAIEPPTMLLSLQTDSAGATIVAMTPSPARLIGELSNVPGVVAPAIVGSVTPVPRAPAPAQSPMPGSGMLGAATPAPARSDTSDADEPMQRVSIHFTWRRAAMPAAPPRESR